MFSKEYADYYDLFNHRKPYQKEAKFVYKWAGRPEYIFDIGPGTGRHWKYYPQYTHILGIEKSQSMADKSNYPSILNEDIQRYNHYEALYGIFDCATALFDVMNYIPTHDWWAKLPIIKGCPFIFDIWDTEKIKKDGFRTTLKTKNGVSRVIEPKKQTDKTVELEVTVALNEQEFTECHTMYLWSIDDIKKFCKKDFEIAEIKHTESWQTWLKLIRK